MTKPSTIQTEFKPLQFGDLMNIEVVVMNFQVFDSYRYIGLYLRIFKYSLLQKGAIYTFVSLSSESEQFSVH